MPPAARSRHERLRIVSALGVFQILSWGSSFYLPAVLAKPIAEDTGWPLPWIVGGLSAGLLVAGLVSPRVGRTISTMGGRPVLAVAAALLALGLAGLGCSPNLPVFFASWIVVGAGMGAGLYDAAFATLGRLFGADARPAITTLTLWGGFASTVCWPLSALLVEHVGWRGACLTYAGVHVLISLPLAVFFIPDPPPSTREGDGARARPAAPKSDRLALLLLATIGVMNGTISAAVSVHLLTILQDRGLALAAAVTLGTLIGPAQVGARLLEMAGRGRHHPMWTLTAAVGALAVGLSLLRFGPVGPGVALAIYGAGNGLYSIARGTVPLALFGPARYARVMGLLATPSLLAQALAPSMFALVLTSANATTTLTALAALAIVNVVLLVALWQVRRSG